MDPCPFMHIWDMHTLMCRNADVITQQCANLWPWTAQKCLGLKVCFLATWPAPASSQEYIYPSLLFHVYVAAQKATRNVGQTQTEMVQAIARTHTRQESQQAGRTSHWLPQEKSHWKIWHTYGFHLSQETKTISKNKQKWTCFQNGKLNHWLPGSGRAWGWVQVSLQGSYLSMLENDWLIQKKLPVF